MEDRAVDLKAVGKILQCSLRRNFLEMDQDHIMSEVSHITCETGSAQA